VRWTRRTIATFAALGLLAASAPTASAEGQGGIPEWVKPAINYLDQQGYWDKATFVPNKPLGRRAFKRIMNAAFGGGFKGGDGKVTAAEVSGALVSVLGRSAVADALGDARSPDGWDPQVASHFGVEVVAREMGLRHDRPTTEEQFESSASEPMTQADIAWAVWKAKTSPATWGADALVDFELSDYDPTRRKVVKFALSLVGTPYVWGGEWLEETPAGYPYGAQPHGGVDCSGFAWYVLRAEAPGWAPVGRPYKGWAFPERSSAEMAKAAPKHLRYAGLLPGDVVFFSPDGREAKASSVYHAGIFLGKGWMVHSSGSRDGISISEMGRGSWWWDQFAWGRRVITS
jgi:cell wall-associated NlpC family hydrolase